MNLRVFVTDQPRELMRLSANVPATTPLDAAMVAHGSALNHAASRRLSPTTCLKYRGIHASKMKMAQLLTKFAMMHAHVGLG